ncbi:MAG: TonB-dependent receptor [Anaerolineales bacterium]|nr:TonB-dependent receptor [Anaerolineales bacterium]
MDDLYWQPGGNDSLKAEQGVAFELGMEYVKTSGQHSLGTELTAYYNNINDWIIWIPNFKEYTEALNIDKVITRGFEYNLNHEAHY